MSEPTEICSLVLNLYIFTLRLMGSNAITELEKEQIEEWLFLKQECEECLSSSEVLRTQKPLVPIQEAEEPEESISEPETSCQQNSDNDTDNESQRPDLAEKLDSLMDEFRSKTDALIQAKHEEFMLKQPKAVMQSQDKDREQAVQEAPAQLEKCDERKVSVGGKYTEYKCIYLYSLCYSILSRSTSQHTAGRQLEQRRIGNAQSCCFTAGGGN